MIATTLTAVPRRITMLAAKATVLTGIVTPAATLAVAGSLLAGRLLRPSHDRPPPLTDGPVLRAALGAVCYLALIALLSLGIATAVRDSATAVGLILGLLYVYPIMVDVVSDPRLRHHLHQLAPKGLGALAVWAAVALLAGGLSLRR